MDLYNSETPLSDPPVLQNGYKLNPDTTTVLLEDTQWFGVDIGGSLVKCVYLECPGDKGRNKEESEGISAMREFVKSNLKYGSTGIRDKHLEVPSYGMGDRQGTLHFIKFETVRMCGFMDMVTKNGLGKFSKIVCATGGGAYKFEDDFKEKLDISLHKYDEMETLIRGIHYFCNHCSDECYYWNNPNDPDKATKQPLDFNPDDNPYIVVNIGSGVSILHVSSREKFKRIGGTSVGGGTFLGLCSLLTKTENFDEAIKLAEKGDHTKVDKLVKDIYGMDYTKLGLTGEVVASSFGHMIHEERRAKATPEDLARASLVTVTNNIGAIAKMCATIVGIERVVFVGNYLCNNSLSTRMLAYAMDYWSDSTIKALFLRHEGYFGAVGSMVLKLEELASSRK